VRASTGPARRALQTFRTMSTACTSRQQASMRRTVSPDERRSAVRRRAARGTAARTLNALAERQIRTHTSQIKAKNTIYYMVCASLKLNCVSSNAKELIQKYIQLKVKLNEY
jgi:hypothetical protein